MLPRLTRRGPLLVLFFVLMAMTPSVPAREPVVEVPHRVAVMALAEGESEPEPTGLASDELKRRIDAYVQPFLDAGHLSGNLLVARGKDVVYERSFGRASFELDVPNTPDTRFNVASITKPMTVVVLLSLVADGKLAMTDKLSKWVPEFPRGDEITIQHLAGHQAGIPHQLTEEDGRSQPRSAADMVELAATKKLAFEPGEQSSYSSGGFSVLARVLELAGGATYQDLVGRYVFQPADMTRSVHTNSRDLVTRRASSYVPDGSGGVVNAPLHDLSYLVGAGSVYSTARDLNAMLAAARDGIYGADAERSLVDDNGIDWNGITNGFRAFADWHKNTDVSVVFTANLHTGAADRMRKDLPRVVAGEDVPAPVLPAYTPVKMSDDKMASYSGVYELRPGSELRMRVVDGDLMVNSWTLVPTGDTVFFSPQDYAVVEVVLGDDGKPLRLDWKIGDNTYPCPRVGDL